jgi:hypothetical protein
VSTRSLTRGPAGHYDRMAAGPGQEDITAETSELKERYETAASLHDVCTTTTTLRRRRRPSAISESMCTIIGCCVSWGRRAAASVAHSCDILRTSSLSKRQQRGGWDPVEASFNFTWQQQQTAPVANRSATGYSARAAASPELFQTNTCRNQNKQLPLLESTLGGEHPQAQRSSGTAMHLTMPSCLPLSFTARVHAGVHLAAPESSAAAVLPALRLPAPVSPSARI